MGKKALLIVAVAAILIVGGFAAKSMLPSGTRAGSGKEGPEIALPVEENYDAYMALKITDAKAAKAKALAISSILSDLANTDEKAEFKKDVDMKDLPKGAQVLDAVSSFLDTAEELSLLLISADKEKLYVSYFADDQKLDQFLKDEGGEFYRAEQWEKGNKPEGSDAWILKPASGNSEISQDFYMLRQPHKGKNLVTLSTSEEELDRMQAALDGSAPHFTPTRQTSAPSYFLMHSKEPLRNPAFSGAEVRTTEMSWEGDAQKTHVQMYADAFQNTTPFGNRAFPASQQPIMGKGDLGAFATSDLLFACYSMFPSASDPVEALFDTFGQQIPEQARGDLREILRNGRITVAFVMGETEPSTAYMMLESSAAEALNKLYGMGSMMIATPATISGWDSAGTVTQRGITVTLARKKNTVLLGIGTPSNYASKAKLPRDMQDIGSSKYLTDFAMTSTLFNLKGSGGTIGNIIQAQMARQGIPQSVVDTLKLDTIDAVRVSQKEPGWADMEIYWKTPR